MIGRMIGAARLNAHTYEEVEADSRATLQALLIVVLVSVVGIVGSLFSGDDIDVVRSVVGGIVGGVAGWAIWALATWIVGSTILKTEQTEANWGQLARCTGFAQTPRLLNVFIFVPVAGGIIAIVAFVWSFAAMVVAVRQALDYTSTWRAFFVILIAAIPVVVMYIIFGIIYWLIVEGGTTT